MPEIIKNNLCLECSQKRHTCCNYEDHYIPLLIEDMKKILALGFKTKNTLIALDFEEDDLSEEDDWWKKNMVKIENKYYQIAIVSRGETGCYFLEEGQGCNLGKERPAICKLYPFWFDEKMQLKYQDDFCEAFRQKISFADCFKIMGENETDVRNYFLKLKKDFKEKKQAYENLTALLIARKYSEFENTLKNIN